MPHETREQAQARMAKVRAARTVKQELERAKAAEAAAAISRETPSSVEGVGAAAVVAPPVPNPSEAAPEAGAASNTVGEGRSPPAEAEQDVTAKVADAGGQPGLHVVHELVAPPQSILSADALGRLASVMEGPAAVEVFRRAISETASAWENSKPEESALREQCYQQIVALRSIQHQIKQVRRRGESAEREADRARIRT